jgi:hypothetical protein
MRASEVLVAVVLAENEGRYLGDRVDFKEPATGIAIAVSGGCLETCKFRIEQVHRRHGLAKTSWRSRLIAADEAPRAAGPQGLSL